MLPKAHVISHSRMSGSRWVITPLSRCRYLGHEDLFCIVLLCILATSSFFFFLTLELLILFFPRALKTQLHQRTGQTSGITTSWDVTLFRRQNLSNIIVPGCSHPITLNQLTKSYLLRSSLESNNLCTCNIIKGAQTISCLPLLNACLFFPQRVCY